MQISKITTKELVVLYDLLKNTPDVYDDLEMRTAHGEILEKVNDLMFNKEVDLERFDLDKI